MRIIIYTLINTTHIHISIPHRQHAASSLHLSIHIAIYSLPLHSNLSLSFTSLFYSLFGLGLGLGAGLKEYKYNTYHLTLFLPISTLLLPFAPLHFHSLLLLHTNPTGTLSSTQREHQSPFPFCNKQSFLYMPTPLPLPLTGSLSLTATIALDATGLHDSVSCNTKRASAPSTGAVPFYPAMQQRS